MKRFKLTLIFLATFSVFAWSQSTISGTIVGSDDSDPLIGASVTVEGTSIGTVTDFDGNFELNEVPSGPQSLIISYIGFENLTKIIDVSGNMKLGTLTLQSGAIGLEEVLVTGVIDLVKDRETPVAVSTLFQEEIQLKSGNQEFPELLKATPSIYATKSSGGYGDGRISVRGFDNTNVAVIINGQPVNDMENGRVFWSNWAGLSDMASGIEVQRGLGASNLAVPSVGGTINVITKSTLAKKGGYASAVVGNDGYLKTTIGYNSGRVDQGWSYSAMVGRWQGDGYIYGTDGEGYNYLFAFGYTFNEKHSINANFLGAGQWHFQRDTELSIRDYQNPAFGDSDDRKDGINRKINADWGMLNGEVYNIRRNFYNKPIASVNWDWNISDKTRVATSLYGSWGRGGGTGSRGRNFDLLPFNRGLTAHLEGNERRQSFRSSEGYILYDEVVRNNRSGDPYTGSIGGFDGQILGSNGFSDDGVNSNINIRRSSINSHNWYGGIANLRHEVGDFTLGIGVDLRSYSGLHYRVLNDLLGLDGYYSTGNDFSAGKIITSTSKAQPFANISESEKLDYYNIGEVGWYGFNGLAEYNKSNINAVIQFGLSNQQYRRVDYFDQLPHESDKEKINGGYLKGGINYNINEKHNVFGNAGFIKRQPFFDVVFPGFANDINEDAESEEITSFELGYGFRSPYLNANFNAYYTIWTNRYEETGVTLDNGAEGRALFSGIENNHSGIELELNSNPIDKLQLNGMLSLGNWEYAGQTVADVFDDNRDKIGTGTLFIDGVKVGDVAQTTFSLGADYNIIGGLSIDATYFNYSNLYADFSILDDIFFEPENEGALELPSYGLIDFGATYKLKLKNKNSLQFRLNINNLLDEVYIAESETNIHDVTDGFSTYQGISNQNRVWFGFGRTWNASVRYKF